MQHDDYLSALIKEEKKKLRKIEKKNPILFFISQVYFPSKTTFFLISSIVCLFFLITHFMCDLSSYVLSFIENVGMGKYEFLVAMPQINLDSNHYQNLIAIHAGIGTIIFALIIFIAESLRDDDVKDRSRVLLKESFLFPLAVAEILVFFLFIWGDINYWSFIPVIIIGLLTIWSLMRTVTVLLSKHAFAYKRTELLKERLQKSIDHATNERLGNNILFSKIDRIDYPIQFHFFSGDSKSKYNEFKTDKKGVVTDINLRKLKEFADAVDQRGKDNRFIFSDTQIPQGNISGSIGLEDTTITKEPSRDLYRPNKKRFMLKKYQDAVSEDSNTLFLIDKELIGDDDQ
jgi:hypothetical protein